MSVSDKSLPTLKDGVSRPTKRTKKLETELLKAIEDGAPFVLACASVGICMDTFINWRRSDPAFAIKVEKVAAKGALKRLRRIEQHGEVNFVALSWMLERRWPDLFAKPEVALNVGIQNNVAANGQNSFELVVIRDLEFAGLRQREGYTHHPEQSAREVEAQVVPEEVSGHLTRDGSEASGQIISESQAESWNQQAEKVRAQVRTMMEKYRPGLGNGEPVREVEPVIEQQAPQAAEQAVITHKAGDEKSREFWQMLVSADPQAPVAKETAVFIAKVLLPEVLGFRGHRVEISFPASTVSVEDLFAKLEALCGGPGTWQLAQKLGNY